MATVDNDPIGECVTAVDDTFTSVFRMIDSWRAAVEALATEADGSVSAAAVDELTESLVMPELSASGAAVIGAGYVASPGFLSDAEWHLAWWLGHSNTFGVGSADPSVRRLKAEEDPASESFRDYTTLEWWRVPARTLAPHITGPYVDYLCTDDYTLTLTVPVTFRGQLIGIVGADLYVNDIERMLLPRVRAIGQTATIVNATGRVVVSSDPQRPTGSLMREYVNGGIQTGGRTAVPCASTSLVMVLDPA